MKRILVTGANGYIGSHVAAFLRARNMEVVASDLVNTRLGKDVEFRGYDILDNPDNVDLYDFFGKPDAVIHLAWKDGFNHYASSHVENLLKHFRFLQNMIEGGCTSLSVMGTAHEVGYHEGRITADTPCNPLSYYGIAKNALRQLLFAYAKGKDVSVKWLRAYYITGDDWNNHSIFTKLLDASQSGQKEFPFTKGTNQFDFIPIGELSRQIALASLQTEVEGVINVCSGEPVSLKDKVEDFIREKNLDVKLIYGAFPPRKYDSPVIYGDDSKIRQILEGAVNG